MFNRKILIDRYNALRGQEMIKRLQKLVMRNIIQHKEIFLRLSGYNRNRANSWSRLNNLACAFQWARDRLAKWTMGKGPHVGKNRSYENYGMEKFQIWQRCWIKSCWNFTTLTAKILDLITRNFIVWWIYGWLVVVILKANLQSQNLRTSLCSDIWIG